MKQIMDLADDTIISLTQKQLPGFCNGQIEVSELHGGGSDRRYFRLRNGSTTIIFSQYGTEREENALFASQTEFLAEQGVSVPLLLAQDEENFRLWIEDLGDTDLWDYREADWMTVKRPLYEATLIEVAKIHALRESSLANPPVMNLPFDRELYEWEQNYFLNHFALNFSDVSADEVEKIRQCAELDELKIELSARSRCLIHRDFQSQNVLIRERRPCLIDYQGLRYGLAEYDIGSLIFDPYVPMTSEEREELIRFCEARSSNPRFRDQLMKCAVQRLMQALGAYGFLGLVKGKRDFLAHIPAAVGSLHEIAVENEIMPVLAPLLSLRESSL